MKDSRAQCTEQYRTILDFTFTHSSKSEAERQCRIRELEGHHIFNMNSNGKVSVSGNAGLKEDEHNKIK